jgi:flavin reductase (DIM6/NTAB) family NADH-FMN oxidoreductase RutF
MFYDPRLNNHGLPNDPFKAVVVPRPIGWISTLSAEGVPNLAPYSFFNAVSEHPHYVAFGSDGMKDSLRNIESTGEFAVNLVTHDLREKMNMTSAMVGSHIDEFELADLSKVPCQFIKAPRVGESPVCFECRHSQTIALPDDEGRVGSWLVLGRVIGVHIDDSVIVNGRVDMTLLKPVARLGYAEYATIDSVWRLRRP